MALDPQINLGVQAPVLQDPIATQEKMESVRALADQRQALAEQRQQQTQALIQKARDQAASDAAIKASGGDLRGAADALDRSGMGHLSQPLRDQYSANVKKLADATDATTKAHQAQLDLAAKIIGSIDPEHPEQYGPAVKAFKATLTDPNDLEAMNQIAPDNATPDQIPAIVDRLNKMQIGAKALFDQHNKYMDEFLAGKYDSGMAGMLAITPPQDRANALKLMTARIPDHDTALAIQQKWTPLLNAKPEDIWNAGLTPEQRTQEADRKATAAETAKRDATAAANTAADNARADAQLALAQAKEKREASQGAHLDISPDIESTPSGRKYIDLGKYTTQERKAVRDAAAAAGATVIADKNVIGHLHDLATARLDQQAVMDDIQSSLPKDATGRAVASPGILMSKLLQTDDQRAAFGAWRTSAINTLKALAGGSGSGLRINQAEINMSLQNDIPQLTDTLATAQRKAHNIAVQMDNAETGILGAEKMVKMQAPNGQTKDVPASQVEHFKALGAKVIGG